MKNLTIVDLISIDFLPTWWIPVITIMPTKMFFTNSIRYRKYIIIFNTAQLFGSIICCVLCEGDSSCVYSFRGQCKINSQLAFLLMLFWLLKDALLAFKRRPLRPLLTPFWSPINHFLFSCFASIWFSDGYKGIEKRLFGAFLGSFLRLLCQYFS